jgi:lipopolysaccharide transport system ATP-binding protein
VNVALRVTDLGKKYILRHQVGGRSRYVALRDVLTDKLTSPFRRKSNLDASREEFWALKDVSFEIKEGEAVGIIGRNGAGKSTLLKLLSRITKPSEGRIEINGRVASLLEVGTGFHPELTGRENIYLNGAILGMHRSEIRQRFDEIVAFSEVEKFLDTPVKHFSSGMYMRLAFAVAAHLDPEILIIDEVLAVGDMAFQKKCLGKMEDVSKDGRTVIFVSHNMAAVRNFCRKGILLEKGLLAETGDVHRVVEKYSVRGNELGSIANLETRPRPNFIESTSRILRVTVNDLKPVYHGEPFKLDLEIRLDRTSDDFAIGFGFSAVDGTRYLSYDSDLRQERVNLPAGELLRISVIIDEILLQPAIYSLDIGMRSGNVRVLDYITSAVQIEVLPGPRTPAFIVIAQPGVRAGALWNIESGTKKFQIDSHSNPIV